MKTFKEMTEEERAVAAREFLNKWCVGYSEGDDLVNLANTFAYGRAIGEKIASCFLLPFNGQNCDNCGGWDGEDRRCDCGNRRVSWQKDDDFSFLDENPYVYGEAY